MKLVFVQFFLWFVFFAHAQTTLTQNSNPNIWPGNSQACVTSGPNTIEDNHFIRVYDLEDYNIQDTVFFVRVETAVDSTSGGNYSLIGSIHKLTGSLLFSNFTLISQKTQSIFPDSSVYFFSIPLDSGYALQNDSIVVDIFAPLNPAIQFTLGTNPYPETNPSYISANACGLSEPTEFSIISLPGIKLILNLIVNHKPTQSDFSNDLYMNYTHTFSKSDFIGSFFDHDSDTLNMIKIVSLPSNGVLELSGSTLSVGDTVWSNELDQLDYLPDNGYYGVDQFQYLVRDGYHWSNTVANVELNVVFWQIGLEENKSEVSIFPNPSSDFIQIKSDVEIKTVMIENVAGQMIYRSGYVGQQISISDYPNALYYVIIETETGIIRSVFIKN